MNDIYFAFKKTPTCLPPGFRRLFCWLTVLNENTHLMKELKDNTYTLTVVWQHKVSCTRVCSTTSSAAETLTSSDTETLTSSDTEIWLRLAMKFWFRLTPKCRHRLTPKFRFSHLNFDFDRLLLKLWFRLTLKRLVFHTATSTLSHT